jgi:hypothetical protein
MVEFIIPTTLDFYAEISNGGWIGFSAVFGCSAICSSLRSSFARDSALKK